jgi:hypothetical protein
MPTPAPSPWPAPPPPDPCPGAAGQVAATLRTLITANLIRQAAGLTTEQTAAQSYAEAEAAFALLESGLSAYSR